ncbi:MAG: septum formation protein Maf [Chlamydiia bacterium]|nr:septum formation protein Maf [Chlamydiia bacterium]
MKIILGTQSPRRKEIFSFFKLPFKQVTSHFDEDSVTETDPIKLAVAIAKGKAEALQPQYPDDLIVTADTVVSCKGKVYGKPKDRQEAHNMLSELSGKQHQVITGLVGCLKGQVETIHERTEVTFDALDEKMKEQYLDQLHLLDKAGSYAIQGSGGVIVKQIEGCYYNVMGLPIHALNILLTRFGVSLWDYL